MTKFVSTNVDVKFIIRARSPDFCYECGLIYGEWLRASPLLLILLPYATMFLYVGIGGSTNPTTYVCWIYGVSTLDGKAINDNIVKTMTICKPKTLDHNLLPIDICCS